jgi:hypothetical protein
MCIRAFPKNAELAHRISGGLEVTLYWTEPGRKTSIEVKQRATGETLAFEVPRDRAYEAFYHPFLYLSEGSAPAA